MATPLTSTCRSLLVSARVLSEYNQRLDSVQTFTTTVDMPEDMRRRMRVYFRERIHIDQQEAALQMCQLMSGSLQNEVTQFCYGRILRKIKFITGCELGFQTRLILALKPVVFTPGETPPGETLYIVRKGLVILSDGKFIGSFNYFGEEVIAHGRLTDRGQYFARCLTYRHGSHD